MTSSDETSADADAGASGHADRSARPADGPEGYEGPGGWGTAAMTLLVVLLLISVGLTVHSLVATFGV